MSRSYKKIAGFTDYTRKYTKWAKRQANKKVRRAYNVPNGKAYRKVYNPWDIHDWVWLCFTRRELIDSWYYKNNEEYKVWIK